MNGISTNKLAGKQWVNVAVFEELSEGHVLAGRSAAALAGLMIPFHGSEQLQRPNSGKMQKCGGSILQKTIVLRQHFEKGFDNQANRDIFQLARAQLKHLL